MPDSLDSVRGIAEAHRRLDSVTERVVVVETQQKDVMRRLEKLEGVPDTLAEIKEMLARLGGKVALIWAVVGMILAGILGLAWEFIKRGGPT